MVSILMSTPSKRVWNAGLINAVNTAAAISRVATPGSGSKAADHHVVVLSRPDHARTVRSPRMTQKPKT